MSIQQTNTSFIITTGDSPGAATLERAEELSAATGAPFIPRGRLSVAMLAKRCGASDVLVLIQDGVRLIRPGRPPLEFHPSMGYIRARRVLKGEADPMLTAARLQPGDSVLDCTAGMGADSLVFSVAAGPAGHVTAIESSGPVCALLMEGMKYYRSSVLEVDEAFKRVHVRNANHLDVLRSLPDRSMDIVYFDPMFRDPVVDSSAIGPLRTYANPAPLEAESIEEACRVARKTVLMKEKRQSSEFSRLGFQVEQRGQTKTVYGVIQIDSTT
ncbi:class I SAM-dependent methyltransferase [Paenibacillus sp. P96]|uniref:Class I SAM-dependent methyltransferase n=1 Tax=Paenibacillus zeirhizosphaerae TaxID=2987519 RepID=A0ABT9FPT1_9BACL|nr:class I SAM-dependent methyltransferase [Paenibacillus sp. P96]MDP4096536.1 class I SAM-dependent methyltransferase [Paenibacillus sp. P96]